MIRVGALGIGLVDFMNQLFHARLVLDRFVEEELENGDAPETHALADLVVKERSGAPQRLGRGLALALGADRGVRASWRSGDT
jgi:hypothetical protein